MKFQKLSIFVVLFVLLLPLAAISQPVEQTLARLFSYDPHPATAMFAEKVPFNGQMADIEIRFTETWNEKKDSANISAISFTISALKSGQILGSANTSTVKITPALGNGQSLGEATLGNLKFKATFESLEKNSDGVTDVTVMFSLVYDTEDLNAARNAEADQSSMSSMTLCTSLAKKADALPDKNAKTKIALYQKALISAPPATMSPAAAEFRTMVENKIAALGGKTETSDKPVEKPINIKPVIAPPISRPSAPATQKTEKSAVSPQARTLYQEAQSLFNQNKGPEAREALRKALEIEPNYYDALVLLGDNAFANRKYSRAKEAFDKAINIENQDADTLLKFFKACYYLGEGSTAIERIATVHNQYPQNKNIALALSEGYFQLGDLPNARSLCEQVLQSDPANLQAKDLLKRIDRLMK
jgi:tetratricopeptide (TPR) repeat protein